jgi:hypothetical protein
MPGAERECGRTVVVRSVVTPAACVPWLHRGTSCLVRKLSSIHARQRCGQRRTRGCFKRRLRCMGGHAAPRVDRRHAPVCAYVPWPTRRCVTFLQHHRQRRLLPDSHTAFEQQSTRRCSYHLRTATRDPHAVLAQCHGRAGWPRRSAPPLAGGRLGGSLGGRRRYRRHHLWSAGPGMVGAGSGRAHRQNARELECGRRAE